MLRRPPVGGQSRAAPAPRGAEGAEAWARAGGPDGFQVSEQGSAVVVSPAFLLESSPTAPKGSLAASRGKEGSPGPAGRTAPGSLRPMAEPGTPSLPRSRGLGSWEASTCVSRAKCPRDESAHGRRYLRGVWTERPAGADRGGVGGGRHFLAPFAFLSCWHRATMCTDDLSEEDEPC